MRLADNTLIENNDTQVSKINIFRQPETHLIYFGYNNSFIATRE